jgi:iron complex outermembrane recepter protein
MQFITKSKTGAVIFFILLGSLKTIAQNGIVNGVVKDTLGKTIINAAVAIESFDISKRTDEQGFFSFSLPVGSYLIIVRSTGKITEKKLVRIKSEETTTLDFILKSAPDLEGVLVLGSRSPRRVATETPVPVDILNIGDLGKSLPQANLSQILNYIAPSFTSNAQTISDGTDHIDPAQLRGLGPDQVLVLVNGKRRHTSALVNVNGTPGRGSVGTDLNAIPAFAIERVEILRDGAAAQYGSDAIAGVINIVMKKNNKLTASILGGANASTGANDHRGGIDGQQVQVDLNYGIPVGKKKGVINLTAALNMREHTRRATDYNGTLFNAYNAIESRALAGGVNLSSLFENINNTPNTIQIIKTIKEYAPQVRYFTPSQLGKILNAATIKDLQDTLGFIGDVTNNELAYRKLQRKDFNMRVGQSKLSGAQFFMNTELPINNRQTFYAFGGYGMRKGNAAGFYRRPYESRTLTEVYPNGFLPEITSAISDASLSIGVRGKIFYTWDYDLSNTFGQNQLKYTIENTLNATQGIKTSKKFNAGKLAFLQNTTNLDLSHNYKVLEGLNLALGGELRIENYAITAGDENSYERYSIAGTVVTSTTLANQLPTDFFGAARPAGAQVFSGFSPKNALNNKRISGAGYLDVELNATKAWLINAALRYENYSDIGSTFSYKLSTRLKIADGLNFRGAVATGFRAPSLQQKYFNSRSTQFIGGTGFEVGTFSNDSRVAQLFGIPNLKQEDSYSYSAGFTYKVPKTDLTFTVDGYYIQIKNRVVLTSQFARPAGIVTGDALLLRQLFDSAGVNSATFFTNAINTASKGIDLIISNRFKFDDFVLKTDVAGTISSTKKVGDIMGSEILKNTGNLNNYFGESSRVYLESAVPGTKLSLMNTLTVRKLEVFLRHTFFGAVTDPNVGDVNGDGIVEGANINGQFIAVEHPRYEGKTLTDFSVSYEFYKNWRITIGANNIFDIYPDKNLKTQTAANPLPLTAGGYGAPVVIDLSNNNQLQYSRNVSQFGFNGRFVFARLSLGIK